MLYFLQRFLICFDQLRSAAPDNFFTKVRIIFDTYYQLNLLLEVSLILVKNYVDFAFSNQFYILYHVHQRKTIQAGAYFKEFCSRREPKFMGLQEIVARKDLIFWSLLYCNLDARSIQFLSKLSIAPIYRSRI